jgi:DegV family protein with EDD domain
MIKLVTDSTCDLPPEWLSHYHITVVPLHIHFGLESYIERDSISPQVFYQRIRANGVLPTTSQPSVGEFCQVYQSLGSDGSQILSIHVTSKLSGTYHSATLAARQLQNQVKVSVVDSLNGSVGLGLLVREAAQLIQAGLSVLELMARLEARRAQVHIFIMLKDLRYARMSGRVGRLREVLASLLNVKPIIGVDQGTLVPRERTRSQHQAFDRMVALAADQVGDAPIHLGLTHALAGDQAEQLLSLAKSRLNCQDTFITDLSLSLAVHFGPGTVGFATYPATG